MLEPLGDDATPPELGGATVADALLEPTVIYVRAVLDLLRSDIHVHGLAHITGGGLTNLQRLSDGVGFSIDSPLPVLPVFALIQRLGDVADEEMYEVFNMGCGFVAVVPAEQGDDAAALLASHHPGARRHRRASPSAPAQISALTTARASSRAAGSQATTRRDLAHGAALEVGDPHARRLRRVLDVEADAQPGRRAARRTAARRP